MASRFRFTVLSVAAGWFSATGAFAQSYTTLYSPSQQDVGFSTKLTGVSGDTIVGTYIDNVTQGAAFDRGMRYDGSSFTSIDYPSPDADATEVTGISGSTVIGTYHQGSNTFGFSFDGSSFVPIDVPYSNGAGVNSTEPAGISGNTIVGTFQDSSNSGRNAGFVYDGSSFTTLNVPDGHGGIFPTEATGLSGGLIVGTYQDSSAGGGNHGFIYDGAGFTTFDFQYPPGHFTPTAPTEITGISENNIIGTYQDDTGQTQGFLYHDGVFSTLGILRPNDSGTWPAIPLGIAGNTIVGTYVNDVNPPFGNGTSNEGFILHIPFGDVNLDGIVNSQDLALVSSNWLASGPHQPGDANGDGVVNSQDLALVSSNWLDQVGLSGAVPVPEPSTIALLAIGAVLGRDLRVGRKRRA